ncbi:MAG: glycosyltransferase family 4 protein [Carnobacterium sp.]|uniref:glycosyltransferase family 4 protein n=1 Tax=Carnobacterium sp. TaxID=48221 RepID=UPI002FC8BC22
MKIGIFTDTYFPQVSGVATSIKTLKEELLNQGHEVFIFTTTDPKVHGEEEDIVRFTSVPFFSFQDRRVAIKGAHRALKRAKELQLDIVHTQTEFSLGLTGKYVAYQLKIPCVHTYHTMYEDYLHYIAKGKVVRPTHVKLASKFFCNQSAAVIAPSIKAKRQLLNYGVTQKIEVIPTGVDLKRFETLANRAIREELNISADAPLLLSLSRVAKEKSIELLIKAMPDVLQQQSTAKLVIVGDGPAKKELENLVDSLALTDSIIFVGEVESSQVHAYYQAADLFVSASDSESQGLTYIEAIASGTDIIARVNDYTENLLQIGGFGALFQEDEEIAEAICRYLSQVKKLEKREEERKVVLNSISSEVFCEKVLQFYRETIRQYSYEKEAAIRFNK